MFDFGTLNPLVESLLLLQNKKQYRNFLTKENFRVVSVRPHLDETGQFNTIVHVLVDLYPGLKIELPQDQRYELRPVLLKRLDLEQAVRIAGGKFNSVRRHIVQAANNKEDAIAALAPLLHIDPDEVTWRATEKEVGVLTAKSNSLGYTGHVTLGVFDADNPLPRLKTIYIHGDRIIQYGKPVQFTATWDEFEYVPNSIVWSIRATDLTGIYINAETGLVYTDRLAAVDQFTVVVTIDGKEATYIVTVDPNAGNVIDPLSISIQGNNLLKPGDEMSPTLIVNPTGAYVKPKYPIWSIASNVTLDGISVDSKTGRITVADDAVNTTFTLIAIVDALVARLDIRVVRENAYPPVLQRVVITGKSELAYGEVAQYNLAYIDPNYVPKTPPVWSVNKSEITSTGKLTAKDPGNHLIKVVVDGMEAYHVVTVKEPEVTIDDLKILGPDELPMYESYQYRYSFMPPIYQPRYVSWSVRQNGQLVYHSGYGSIRALASEGEITLVLRVDQKTVEKKVRLVRPKITKVTIYDPKPGVAVEADETRALRYKIEPAEAMDNLENVRWSSVEGVKIQPNGDLTIDVYKLKTKDFLVEMRYNLPNDPTEYVLQHQMFASSKPQEFKIELPDAVEANSDNQVKITIFPQYITVADMEFKIVPPVANASVADGRLLLNGAPYESIITVVGKIDTMEASDSTYVKYPDLTGIKIISDDYVIAGDSFVMTHEAVPKDARLPRTNFLWSLVEPIPEGVTLDPFTATVTTENGKWGKDIVAKIEYDPDPSLGGKVYSATKTIPIMERKLSSMALSSDPFTRDIESVPVKIVERPTGSEYLGGTWALVPDTAGTVTSDGKVTITSPLVSSVEVNYTAPSGIVGKVTVPVIQPLISVSIALSPDYLRAGEASALRYSLYPPTTVDPRDGVWEILEGAEFVQINNGRIIASSNVGEKVRIRYTVGGKSAEREYEILPVPLEALTVTIGRDRLVRDREEQLIITYTPTNATIVGEGKWVFNVDPSKVIIGDGKITVLADDIRVLSGSYTVDGITGNFTFPVDQPARKLNIVTNPLNPIDNSVMSLTLVAEPASADIDPVVWSIAPNNPETILYDGNMVKLFNEGGKTVKVTVNANGVVETRDVAIEAVRPTSLVIPPWTTQLLPVGNTRRLDVQFTPSTVTNPVGTWEIIPPTAGTLTDNMFVPNATEKNVGIKFTHTATGMTVSGTIPIAISVSNVIINLPDEIPDFSTFTPSYQIVPESATITDPAKMIVEGPDQMINNGDGSYTLDGIDYGNVRVTVYVNGEVFTKVAKIVPQLPTSIEILGVPPQIRYGDEFQLTAQWEPEKVSDPVVYWQASPFATIDISPTGYVKVIADSTDARAVFTVWIGPVSHSVAVGIWHERDYNHGFTPVGIGERALFQALVDANIITAYPKENPVVYGFRTVENEIAYVADIVYETPRQDVYGYTFRIPVDVWNIINDPANTASNAQVVTITVNGQTHNYGCNDIIAKSVQLGQEHYFYVDNSHYPTVTGKIHVKVSELIAPYTDDYDITINVSELKPSLVTPVYFTATQLNDMKASGIIDDKMTGRPISDVTGGEGLYQVELEVPRRGSDDYALYGLLIDNDSWEAIKLTALRKSNYPVLKLQSTVVTAAKLVAGSIQDVERGGWIYPVRVYRYTPDLDVVNVLGTYDIQSVNYGIGNTMISVIRRRDGWKPGDGLTFRAYVVPSTDALVQEAIKQGKIANNVVRTARVSEAPGENDLWIIDAFYPTNEANRTVAVSYIIPDDTIAELKKIRDDGDTFRGIQVIRSGALVRNFTAEEFLNALTYYENTPFYVTSVAYQTIPQPFNLVIDFDGPDEYYYETFTAKALIRFDMAEIARMTPVTTPEWVLQEWDQSPNKSEYFNSEVVPYLTGLTYKAAFPYNANPQGTLLSFMLSKKTYDKIRAMDDTTPIMRAISGGVAKTMARDELLAHILVNGDEIYFVDEAYALVNNSSYSYRYDWDGNLMETETGTTTVYFQFTMGAKPEDPRILSKLTPTQLTENILAMAKTQGALQSDTTTLAKVETTWVDDSQVTVKTTVPYRENPQGIRYAIALFINKAAVAKMRTMTEQDGVVYRERRTIKTETGERPVILEYNAPLFLSDTGTVVDGDVVYRFLEFGYGETLENVEFDLDWDGVLNDYRSNTVIFTHNSIVTTPPQRSVWEDKSKDTSIYSRIVALVQAPYGAANMVPYFEFTEAVEMVTTDESPTLRLTKFTSNAIAPGDRWYAPVPLILDTAVYNVLYALYGTVANRSLVIGSMFDSRTTITQQFTLGQFIENFTVNDSTNKRFYFKHVVNLGGEDATYHLLMTFDFDIAGFAFDTTQHRVEVNCKRMRDFDAFITYTP